MNSHPRTYKNETIHQKELQEPFIMLIIAPETATVQAQEQRAKDAKSFRRLYASDIKIVYLFPFQIGISVLFLFLRLFCI